MSTPAVGDALDMQVMNECNAMQIYYPHAQGTDRYVTPMVFETQFRIRVTGCNLEVKMTAITICGL